jgi:hypothetical protein
VCQLFEGGGDALYNASVGTVVEPRWVPSRSRKLSTDDIAVAPACMGIEICITIGFDAGDGFVGRLRGSDITRFRCAGRCFVSISHPDYADHVLHEARLKYVKSNEYEPVRASAGINLLTDEGDSWAAHRGVLNPTFAVTNRSPCWAA